MGVYAIVRLSASRGHASVLEQVVQRLLQCASASSAHLEVALGLICPPSLPPPSVAAAPEAVWDIKNKRLLMSRLFALLFMARFAHLAVIHAETHVDRKCQYILCSQWLLWVADWKFHAICNPKQ